MAESHFETRSRIKIFYRATPRRTSTVLAVPTPSVGIAALRRPPAPSAASGAVKRVARRAFYSRSFRPAGRGHRSAMPSTCLDGGIPFCTRSRIKMLHRATPRRTSTVLAVPTAQVGIAALRRPWRRAQRQAPEIESQCECLIPVRSALPGGGIAARCPLPLLRVRV